MSSAIKECIDKSKSNISEIKILIHQANAKMDDAIVNDFINFTI